MTEQYQQCSEPCLNPPNTPNGCGSAGDLGSSLADAWSRKEARRVGGGAPGLPVVQCLPGGAGLVPVRVCGGHCGPRWAAYVTNWPESSGWATDAFTRTLTEQVDHEAPSAKCGGTPQCYFVTGEITDNGTFQTVAGAASPNGSSSAKISGVLDGTMQGTAHFEFYTSSNKLAVSNVPVSADGSAKPASTTDWGELGFPSGTTFAGVNLTAYDWTCVAPATCEQWNDQINPGDDGQGPSDGNITGVNACK